MSISLYVLTRRLTTDITRVLARLDPAVLDTNERQLVKALRSTMIDARLDVRDYEFAETRAEQLHHAADGRRRLEQLRQGIVAASGQDLFSAIEVAGLSAQVDRIMDGLA